MLWRRVNDAVKRKVGDLSKKRLEGTMKRKVVGSVRDSSIKLERLWVGGQSRKD